MTRSLCNKPPILGCKSRSCCSCGGCCCGCCCGCGCWAGEKCRIRWKVASLLFLFCLASHLSPFFQSLSLFPPDAISVVDLFGRLPGCLPGSMCGPWSTRIHHAFRQAASQCRAPVDWKIGTRSAVMGSDCEPRTTRRGGQREASSWKVEWCASCDRPHWCVLCMEMERGVTELF